MPEVFAYGEAHNASWCPFGTVLFREEVGDSDNRPITVTKEKDEGEQERALRCKLCGVTITTSKQKIARDGKHLHTFFNPAGIVYELGCFLKAPGCLVHGPESFEFPWFSGHSWQVSYCIMCREHLGWYFQASSDAFFGLIVNRLVEG
jgi:hypothetical protein